MLEILAAVGVNLLSMGINYALSSDKSKVASKRRSFLEYPKIGDPIPVVYGTVPIDATTIWNEAVRPHGHPRGWRRNIDVVDNSGNSTRDTSAVAAMRFHAVLCQGHVDAVSRIMLKYDSKNPIKGRVRLQQLKNTGWRTWSNLWDGQTAIYLPEWAKNGIDGADLQSIADWADGTSKNGRALIPQALYATLCPAGVNLFDLPNFFTGGVQNYFSNGVAYRHVTSIFGMLTNANGTYKNSKSRYENLAFPGEAAGPPEQFSMRVSRYSTHDNWYPAFQQIGLDINPVHALYDLLTSPVWGGGLDTDLISQASWQAAAQAASNAGLGVSFILEPSNALEHMQALFEVIDAVPRIDPATGKLQIALFKDKPVPVASFNDSSAQPEWVKETAIQSPTSIQVTYPRRNLDDTLVGESEVTHLYRFVSNRDEVILQKHYPLLRDDAAIAIRIARDFAAAQRHYRSASLAVPFRNDIRIGDVVNWESGIQGVQQSRWRVTRVEYGDATSNTIVLECREDLNFGDEVITTPPPPPENPPVLSYEVPEATVRALPLQFDLRGGPGDATHLTDFKPTFFVEGGAGGWFQAYLAGENFNTQVAEGFGTFSFTVTETTLNEFEIDGPDLNPFSGVGGLVDVWIENEIVTLSLSAHPNATAVQRALYDTVRPPDLYHKAKAWLVGEKIDGVQLAATQGPFLVQGEEPAPWLAVPDTFVEAREVGQVYPRSGKPLPPSSAWVDDYVPRVSIRLKWNGRNRNTSRNAHEGSADDDFDAPAKSDGILIQYFWAFFDNGWGYEPAAEYVLDSETREHEADILTFDSPSPRVTHIEARIFAFDGEIGGVKNTCLYPWVLRVDASAGDVQPPAGAILAYDFSDTSTINAGSVSDTDVITSVKNRGTLSTAYDLTNKGAPVWLKSDPISGKPALAPTYNDMQDGLFFPDNLWADGLEAITVCAVTSGPTASASSADNIILTLYRSASYELNINNGNGGQQRVILYNGSGLSTAVSSGNTGGGQCGQIYAFDYDAGTTTIYRDNTQIGSLSGAPAANSSANTSGAGSRKGGLGCSISVGGLDSYQGYIHAVYVYDRILSTQERSDFQNWVNAKWKI